jgi:hypothetical protein
MNDREGVLKTIGTALSDKSDWKKFRSLLSFLVIRAICCFELPPALAGG